MKHFFDLKSLADFINQSVTSYYNINSGDMLDQYTQRTIKDENCLGRDRAIDGTCPVEMDVSYIKKSKDKQYHLVYFLTRTDLAYFTDEGVEDGSLKNFI